jgi:hypothetical protein
LPVEAGQDFVDFGEGFPGLGERVEGIELVKECFAFGGRDGGGGLEAIEDGEDELAPPGSAVIGERGPGILGGHLFPLGPEGLFEGLVREADAVLRGDFGVSDADGMAEPEEGSGGIEKQGVELWKHCGSEAFE